MGCSVSKITDGAPFSIAPLNLNVASVTGTTWTRFWAWNWVVTEPFPNVSTGVSTGTAAKTPRIPRPPIAV